MFKENHHCKEQKADAIASAVFDEFDGLPVQLEFTYIFLLAL